MAKRGTSKALSVLHEDKIAKELGGKRSPSSGGADNDSGDVRTKLELVECKMTGGPERKSSKPKFVKDLEKVTEEAFSEGRKPILALRYFDPDSILSDSKGWIDLIVRPLEDYKQDADYLVHIEDQLDTAAMDLADLEHRADYGD
jgi:hypothetical protein